MYANRAAMVKGKQFAPSFYNNVIRVDEFSQRTDYNGFLLKSEVKPLKTDNPDTNQCQQNAVLT